MKRSRSPCSPSDPGNRGAADDRRAAGPDPRKSSDVLNSGGGELAEVREAPSTSSADPLGSRELGLRACPKQASRAEENIGNLPVSPCPVRDVRLRESPRDLSIPAPPTGNYVVNKLPLDLNGREPNASTVFIGNVARSVSEMELLILFNGIDGTYGNQQPNVVAAVNFAYRDGKFNGQAYFMYTTVELAEYAVRKLHDRKFHGRDLYVRISNCRLDVGNSSRRGNVLGSSRAGEAIWNCPPPARFGQQRA